MRVLMPALNFPPELLLKAQGRLDHAKGLSLRTPPVADSAPGKLPSFIVAPVFPAYFVCEHVEILLGGVEDGQTGPIEQRHELIDVRTLRVDQHQLVVPRELHQRQLRVVGPLAVELRVEGIAGRPKGGGHHRRGASAGAPLATRWLRRSTVFPACSPRMNAQHSSTSCGLPMISGVRWWSAVGAISMIRRDPSVALPPACSTMYASGAAS